MINLASDDQGPENVRRTDDILRDELFAAGADVVVLPDLQPNSEVPTHIQGKVGDITLVRAWYYWVANGPVPLKIAQAMYEHPVGRANVRVGGHCGCPPPVDPWLTYRDRDGNELWNDTERAEFEKFAAKFDFSLPEKTRWSTSPATDGEAYVETYHIDTIGGLRLFVDSVRVKSAQGAGEVIEQPEWSGGR